MNLPALLSIAGPVPDPRWALLLDVDGTLLHIAETPDGVARSAALCRLLSRLTPALDGAVALISGRTIEDLDRLFEPLKPPAAGLHGLEHRNAKGQISTLGEAEALDHLRAPLAKFAAGYRGLLLEDKGRALAFHYRLAPEREAEVKEKIKNLTGGSRDLRTIHGKMVVEIKPRHADKGSAVRAFMTEAPFHGRIPVFLGDDVTDEDAFKVVNELNGLSIRVGPAQETAARHRLDGVDQVLQWLTQIADSLTPGGEE